MTDPQGLPGTYWSAAGNRLPDLNHKGGLYNGRILS